MIGVMHFEIVDFSGFYYGVIASTPVPARREGKFVRISDSLGDRTFLVLYPTRSGCSQLYHANIVERFCIHHEGIEGVYGEKRDHFEILEPGWKVIGGGFFSLDEDRKTLRLHGTSKAYGQADLDALKVELAFPSDHALADYLIVTEG